ncbi:MAG: nicotinate phosphoribosyltransferase [Actinomycetaceae bacterium]|nr:nicotinate phosphoribosyltransferase [Actinomycetaceae bacterium]
MASTSASTALLTDMYELTMLDSAIASGKAWRSSVFEVFGRRLPGGRRYGVVCGTDRILEAINNFRFTDDELSYLRSLNILSEETLKYLNDFSFQGNLYAYPEGECYFPNSPILQLEGTFAECVILETLILSILNHDSSIATAASRMITAAHGRPCVDFGSRRTHEESAVHAARAAVIAGFAGTSNLEAGRRYGLKVSGTSAHAFTLLHENEKEAFQAQINTMGTNTTLLIDTYDVDQGLKNAVEAARNAGGELGSVRVDSGDLVAGAFFIRKKLDDLGAHSTKIVITNDLDEDAIASLNAAPADSYGVGTKLVTGSGYPTAELVFKLVSREDDEGVMQKVEKLSESKHTAGGFKVAGRLTTNQGRASQELVVACRSWEEGQEFLRKNGARPLQKLYIKEGHLLNGITTGIDAIKEAQERLNLSRNELPDDGWRLSPGDPAVPTKMLDIIDINDMN